MGLPGLPALALMVVGACALDRLLGEPTRFHPLIGFGRMADRLELRLNHAANTASQQRQRGLMAWIVLVLAPALAAELMLSTLAPELQLLGGTIVLYIAMGGRSLQEHAARVHQDLQHGNLSDARQHVSWLVSRDTRQLDEAGVSKACIESVLENGNDALFAPIFWFCVFGPAGAILYRLANTLDAMWGYRTTRYLNFGRAAAKLDDALNYIPARLTALGYALVGKTSWAMSSWKTQAAAWDSPNAGPVMAAGAAALGVILGGAANYHGTTEERPILGTGNLPVANDIARAQTLVRHALWLWVTVISVGAVASLII